MLVADERTICERLDKSAEVAGVNITAGDKRFYLKLLDLAWKNDERKDGEPKLCLSIVRISAALGGSARGAQYHIEKLVMCGAIQRITDKENHRRTAETIFPAEIWRG